MRYSCPSLSESDVTGHLHFMTLSLASTALIVGGWLKQRFLSRIITERYVFSLLVSSTCTQQLVLFRQIKTDYNPTNRFVFLSFRLCIRSNECVPIIFSFIWFVSWQNVCDFLIFYEKKYQMSWHSGVFFSNNDRNHSLNSYPKIWDPLFFRQY